jgi:hypothetical protein
VPIRRIIAAALAAAAAWAAAGLAAAPAVAAGERHVLLGLDRPERALNDLLARVSDPESPAYRRQMAAGGVRTTLSPTGGFSSPG